MLPDLEPDGPGVGDVVEGKFHNERGVDAFEEDPIEQHPAHGQHRQVDRHQPPGDEGGLPSKEGRRQEDDDGHAGGAGHQRGQLDGEQPGPPILDDAGAHHGGHVAAKAEEEGQEGLAVQPHQVHKAVHHVGCPCHIAHILQQAEEGEEEDEDGQEGEHRPRPTQHAVGQEANQPDGRSLKPGPHHGGPRLDDVDVQPVLDRCADGVGEPKGRPHNDQEEQEAPKRMGGHLVQPVGEGDLSGTGAGDSGANHPGDPVVASPGHRQDGVLVLPEQPVHLVPPIRGELPAHHLGDLTVPLQQLEGHPGLGVGLRHVAVDQPPQFVQHLPMVGPDLRRTGVERDLASHHRIHRFHQLPQPLVLRGDHRDDGQPQGSLEDVRLDPHPLHLGHIHHVEPHHHRYRQAEEFGHQVEVALQGGGVHDGHHHVGPLPDDEVAGDPLLRRVGRQAIGARQVHDAHEKAVVVVRPHLLLNGLARPVAHVLVQTGQHVEDGRLAHVGLAGQGNRDHPLSLGQMLGGLLLGQREVGRRRVAMHRAHSRLPSALGLTKMRRASPWPSAIRVSRTWTISGPRPGFRTIRTSVPGVKPRTARRLIKRWPPCSSRTMPRWPAGKPFKAMVFDPPIPFVASFQR